MVNVKGMMEKHKSASGTKGATETLLSPLITIMDEFYQPIQTLIPSRNFYRLNTL